MCQDSIRKEQVITIRCYIDGLFLPTLFNGYNLIKIFVHVSCNYQGISNL